MKVALVNSPGIFTDRKSLTVSYREISADEFCSIIRENPYDSAIGHPGAAEFIRMICGVDVPVQRRAIDIADYDEVVGMTLKFRPEPGKEYSVQDLRDLIEEGKIRFFVMLPR